MRHFRFAAVVCLAALLLGACGEESARSEQKLLERARASAADNDLKAAEIDLKAVLQRNSRNSDARLELGELYLALEKGAAAQKELELAAEYDSALEIEHLLARALLLQGRFGQVTEMAIAPGLTAADHADLLSSMGIAFLALEQIPRAETVIASARELSGASPYVQYAAAILLAAKGEADQAEQALQATLQAHPGYGRASSLLGDLALREGQMEEAEKYYSDAIAHKPASLTERLKRAWIRVRQEQYEAAGVDLAALERSGIQDPQISFVRGLLLYQQGQDREAQQAFEQALKLNPKHAGALYYSGALNYRLGNLEVAEARLSAYVSQIPGDTPANQLLAAIQLRHGDYKKAERIARQMLGKEEMNVLTLALLGNSLLAQNLDAEGVAAFEKIVAIEPQSAAHRFNYAQALLKQGDSEKAVEELEQAVEIDPSLEVAQEKLVLTHLRNGDLEQALHVSLEYRDNYENRPSASVLLGTVYMQLDRTDEAAQAFGRALQLDPGNSSANSGLAAIALRAGDLERAKEYYNDTLQKHPDELSTLLNLASVQKSEIDLDGMQATLYRAVETNPSALKPRLLLAQHFIFQGEPRKAVPLLTPVRERHSASIPLLSLLAEAQFRSGDYPQARSTLDSLLSLEADNAVAHYTLARVLFQLGEQESASRELDETLRLDPDHWRARSAKIDRLLYRGELAEAERQIDILGEQLGERPDVLLLQGRLQQLSGKPAAALALYRKSFEQSSNNISLIRQGSALVDLNRDEEAYALFNHWLEEHPEDTATMLELGHLYLQAGDLEEAQKVYARVAELTPGNAAALNNLAWLLIEHSPRQAVKFARSAVDLAPNSASFRDTYAMALRAAGDPRRARVMIGKAVAAAPENSVFRYHRAQILNDLGEYEAALKDLSVILQPGKDFEGREDAEALRRAISRDIAKK